VNAGDTAWVLICAALVLFMTVGLAFFYAGLEPSRNVLDMLAMNFFTICIVTIVWFLIGFTLAFGPDAGAGIIGNLHYAALANMHGTWPGSHIPKLAFMLFQMMFAIITPALITGAVAGRMKFEAWIAFCVGWSLVVYPVLAHWVFDPQGWLYRYGARDFAGGAVVHASAGAAALVVVVVLGPRSITATATYRPHSVPMVLLGAGILWFGWFGFNAGSALSAGPVAASAFAATQIAGAASCLAWAAMERVFTGKATVVGMATGAVVGLATITPGSGYVEPISALAIGVAAGVVCYAATQAARRQKRFDDSFGVLAAHGVGGSLGMILLGVFAAHEVNPTGLASEHGDPINGLVSGHGALLWHQTVAVSATLAFTLVVTYGLARLVRATIGMRVPPGQEEALGLNAGFDRAAYSTD
jgi:Amt family ammonium transporter